MKLIGKYLSKKNIQISRELDEKTIFHLFDVIIREEYGRVGGVNIRPRYYKKGKIFVDINNSNWANELWINKRDVIRRINNKIGHNEIKDIGV